MYPLDTAWLPIAVAKPEEALAVARFPIAVDPAPVAFAFEPIAIAPVPDAAPPPAEYCAFAILPTATVARAAMVSNFTARDLLGLPRADEISDAATHAPRASFQMVLYDLFIFAKPSQVTRDTNRLTGIEQTNPSGFLKPKSRRA